MIDIGKICDVAILAMDVSFGFEMETFEFLNVLQQHGFPRVLGVVTHLDKIEKQKKLRKTLKKMKKRFWTEIYKGATLFRMGHRYGKYERNDIKNLVDGLN